MKPLLRCTLLLAFGEVCLRAASAPPGGHSAGQPRHFFATAGSKVAVEGETGFHGWRAEGNLVTGFLEAGNGFPGAVGEVAPSGTIAARAEVLIPVRNLKATGSTWEPYNEQFTDAIHRGLRAERHPMIVFHLPQLLPRRASPPAGATEGFEAKGDLGIAGVTSPVSIPIQVQAVAGARLRISVTLTLKQSDFNLIPRPTALNCFGGDSDTTRITFEWLVIERGEQ